MEFHIRYTCSGELQQRVVEFIMKNAQQYIIAREFASREHIQCYVKTNVVKKTWVNKFNLKFTTMDRRDKYVEPDKGNTTIYVCKGISQEQMPDIIAKLGFDDSQIEELHNKYWEAHSVQNTIEISDTPLEVVTARVKKPAKPTFMKQIREVLEDEYPDKEWSMKDKCIVFKKLMYMLGQGCKNLDHIIISRMTYGVLNSLIKDKQEWLEYWFSKSFGEQMNPHDDNTDIFTDSKYVY